MMTNAQQARFNMIEQQIRPAEVLDGRVLDTIALISRHEFVPPEYVNLAYADTAIPLGHGQSMMPPILEARMLQALNVQHHDKVLEVGTGSGYTTALLSKLAKQVVSVEIVPELQARARESLEKQGIDNVILEIGDAAKGWQAQAPYSAIAVTGSMPVLAEEFKQQLNIGGRLFAIVGRSPVMSALLITRIDENNWSREVLFETEVPMLKNALQPSLFIF